VLSHQIRQLERELGMPLFERTSRRVAVTEAGRAVAARARRVLAELDGVRQEVDELSGVLRGRVWIGAAPTGRGRRRPRPARPLQPGPSRCRGRPPRGRRRRHVPDAGCRRSRRRLCLLPDDVPDDLATERLSDEEVIVAFAPDRAPPGPRVDVADLARHAIVAPRRGSTITAAMDGQFAHAGQPPYLALESDDPFLLRALAARGFAAAILPRSLTTLEGPPLAVRSLEPEVRLPVALVWRRRRIAPPAARAFVEFVRRRHALARTSSG
jgi:DNA-binding transcriptional LysR family regulator